MGTEARLASKGPTTIPKEIRDRLGLTPGTRLMFTLMTDGTVVMRAKRGSIKDLAGFLHKTGRKPRGPSAKTRRRAGGEETVVIRYQYDRSSEARRKGDATRTDRAGIRRRSGCVGAGSELPATGRHDYRAD